MSSSPVSPEASLDAICTCKLCNHRVAKECAKINCICCSQSNHSMVMDGIEGFGPATTVK